MSGPPLTRRILPSAVIFASLFGAALLFDYLLHLAGLRWIGRYLGIVGTILLLASLAYSLRKHGIMRVGNHRSLLRQHEAFGWLGSAMILIHAGVHFNAFVPWVAAITMVVVVASGTTGRYLLRSARDGLHKRRAELVASGKSAEEIENSLESDALLTDVMEKWRAVHMPITLIFAAYAIIHILSILLLWGWK